MRAVFILTCVLCTNFVKSHLEPDSTEDNNLDMAPFYDPILYSDIAEIIGDITNMNAQIDNFSSGSDDSEENIENLLFEYQHYLEKAKNQRKNYLEKSKNKNKVPVIRHDKYLNAKPGNLRFDESYPNSMKLFTNRFLTPSDILIPAGQKHKYFSDLSPPHQNSQTLLYNDNIVSNFDKILSNQQKVLNLLRGNARNSGNNDIKSSCPCSKGMGPCPCKPDNEIKINASPCLCNKDRPCPCNSMDIMIPQSRVYPDLMWPWVNRAKVGMDDPLSVHVKLDIQMPKLQDLWTLGHYRDRIRNEAKTTVMTDNDSLSKESVSSVNLPLHYFNIPIPLNLHSYNRNHINKYDSPQHKLTTHKKKKSKVSNNNGNKKHKKKIITFHKINIEPQRTLISNFDQVYNFTESEPKTEITTPSNVLINETEKNLTFNITESISIDTVDANSTNTESKNQTQPDKKAIITVSAPNNESETENIHKGENSIEVDYTKIISNSSTDTPLTVRRRRDVNNTTFSDKKKSEVTKKYHQEKDKPEYSKKNILGKNSKANNESKKLDKEFLLDSELLLWPTNIKNNTVAIVKNITSIIVETENNKAKFNLSKESIRVNHTAALEHAIFGQVDWNDVDAVVPAFVSFVGKYARGVLTFCSSKICHSINCSEKKCAHRVCVPEDRLNQRGHCTGSNFTDSEASMESIMDLPSNVAFEIVDILQDKMLGKLFGKVTLCISSKCITFAASKKNFVKFRCSIKDATKTGHCPPGKVMKVR